MQPRPNEQTEVNKYSLLTPKTVETILKPLYYSTSRAIKEPLFPNLSSYVLRYIFFLNKRTHSEQVKHGFKIYTEIANARVIIFKNKVYPKKNRYLHDFLPKGFFAMGLTNICFPWGCFPLLQSSPQSKKDRFKEINVLYTSLIRY